MKKFSLLLLLLFPILLLASCGGFTQDDIDKAREEGYNSGFSEGYNKGYEKGEEAGHKEGYQEGYSIGHDAGHDEGYAEGYDVGYHVGITGKLPPDITYVANKSSMKFHRPDCSSVNDIKSSNRLDWKGTREELIDKGYEPCQKCNP